jgi:PAS domain S-box-containing protein
MSGVIGGIEGAVAGAPRPLRERSASAVETIPQIVWTTRSDGYCDYVASCASEYLGKPAHVAHGWDWLSLVHPEDADRARARWTRSLKTGAPCATEYRLLGEDGAYHWVTALAQPVVASNGEVERWIGTWTFDTFFETSTDLCAIVEDGRFQRANRAWKATLGLEPDELVGVPPLRLLHPDDVEGTRRAVAEAAKCGELTDLENRYRHADGSYRWLLWSARWSHGRWFATGKDITERVSMERELKAAHDHHRAVTESMGEGVYALDQEGRVTYMNRAAEELLGWRQEELAGLVMHDVTHYLRPNGSPLPLDDCPLMRVSRGAEKVRVLDDIFIRRDGSELPVEYTSAPFVTAEGVRGLVVVFSDITARKAREHELQRRIDSLAWVHRTREALDSDRLALFAQPIVDLATGATTHCELLLRMRTEAGDLVQPGEFLPACEQHGMITEVDRWVVRAALDVAATGRQVSLNLSAASVASHETVACFRRAFDESGADPRLVTVELTETALVEDADAARSVVEAISGLGCSFALDDFGTGFGGFTYMKRLPVDYLKIDVEFVSDLVDNQASQNVVKSIVSMAKNFNQRTIAEGVEGPATLELLREYGVDYAQGYFLGRPRPLAESVEPVAVAL